MADLQEARDQALRNANVTSRPPERSREQALEFVNFQRVLANIAGTLGDTTRGRQPFPHPFPARMPEEVATAAVIGLTKPGDVVLDPMSGSGTVPYVARRIGRVAIARDVDPLAVVLSRAR